jgi:hypothetical protein
MGVIAALVAAVALQFAPSQHHALASWFYDAGATASGRHYRYGYASLMFESRWGHRVRFCHRGRCAVGRLEDHGPYIIGRSFDLNPALRDRLRCGGLCWLRWSEIP